MAKGKRRQERFTRKEKIKLGKLLGQDLTGKSNAEIRRILEEHDKKMPNIDRWIGSSKFAA